MRLSERMLMDKNTPLYVNTSSSHKRPSSVVRSREDGFITQNCLKGSIARSLFIALFAVAASITLHAQSGPAIGPASAQPATKVGRYFLQSNPWVNLHQRLLYEARFKEPPPAALSGEDLAKWKKAVEIYRVFLGNRNPIVDEELRSIRMPRRKTRARPSCQIRSPRRPRKDSKSRCRSTDFRNGMRTTALTGFGSPLLSRCLRRLPKS